MRATLRLGLTVLVWVTVMTLLKACAAPAASETSRTICRELRRDLPTYSTRDTAETLNAGARFVAVFNAVCQQQGA